MYHLGLGVFFLSGLAALLYQVVWQRMLAIFSGSDVYSSTIIVAAFMAGLGLGNLAGGQLADRLTARRNLLMFAAAETAIGVYALASRWLLYDVLYLQVAPLAPGTAAGAAILFATLLWPTFFMGMSLPLLARALTVHIDRAASTIGALYGLNTLGAAIGALAATWWALPRFGLDGSLYWGAAANLACAAVVLPVALRAASSPAAGPVAPLPGGAGSAASTLQPAEPGGPPTHTLAGRRTLVVWASVYALSGMLALSFEILWFRLLGVMVKSTAFTFGTLLAFFLTGLAAGSLVGGRFAARVRRPVITFLGLQAGVGLSAALLIWSVVAAAGVVEPMREYFGSYEPLDVRQGLADLSAALGALATGQSVPGYSGKRFVGLYAGLPAALILPPTFLMGLSFPVLQRIVQTDLAHLGRRVGLLLVANIVGSVVGTVATGWILLDGLGTAGTLRLLTALSATFLLAAVIARLREAGGVNARALRPAAAVVFFLALPGLAIARMPDGHTLWARLHGSVPDRIIAAEDATGLSVLVIDPLRDNGPSATVFVNGVGQSRTPFGGVHTGLGMMPAFVHPDPKDAAIIGLGSGDTLYALAGRPTLERITSIEIIGAQIHTLRAFADQHDYRGLTDLFADPRIEHVAGDGRRYLQRSSRLFDIIEADALRPTSAYSGNLYSQEYFRLLRSRLKPNGLAATWAPTPRIRTTFLEVFPHAIALPEMLIGSAEPIAYDRDAVLARLADPRVEDYYRRAGIDLPLVIRTFVTEPVVYGPDDARERHSNLNTDLFPRDEFDLRLP